MKQAQHQAFLDQYESIHPAFIRYCSSRAFGIMQTEDLAQETILATLQSFERIENTNKLLGYMIGIVNNIIRNKKRRLKFKGQWDEQLAQQLESKNLDPATALDVQYLIKAIDQLPTKQKEALILFEISGMSIKEISESQNSSESATKTRLSRARKELRESLANDNSPMPLSKRLAIYTSILF